MAAAVEDQHYLLIRSGERIVALALAGVRETMRPLPVEAVPGVPSFVLGVAVIRGLVTPVIDVTRMLAADGAVDFRHEPQRYVTVRIGERFAALAVENVVDVRALPHKSLEDVPALLRSASSGRIAAMGVLDQRLLVVLDTTRLVPSDVWGAIETRGVAA